MKITYFKIENFRNIRLAECSNPPDFVVICGGNGCGKSAILQALMTAKENAAPYGGFNADPRSVSADAEKAQIQMRLQFSQRERDWHKTKYNVACPEFDDVILEIARSGRARVPKRSQPAKNLLSWFSRKFSGSPGFFDYIDAHRFHSKKDISRWDSSSISDNQMKSSLGARGAEKFQFTKEYLVSLVMKDAQQMLASKRTGILEYPDSLAAIREFFDRFFAPMKFIDVLIDTSPFQFVIRTQRGDIDIDDLSAGEKEILNTFIRFHQLAPKEAVILFDEADAHLHPDLERRYLSELRKIGLDNQVWLTTHSPEMMIEAGSESLFTVLKEQPGGDGNQFVQVTTTQSLHDSLSDLMGSRGLVSFNQRIVFIEGTDSSTDRLVYERLYPSAKHNVSFVPAGDSGSVRRVAERVNDLLTSTMGFQQFHSIVDGDIDRFVADPANGKLHKLPVYHVENFLLDEKLMFDILVETLGLECPYKNVDELIERLHSLLIEDGHLKPYASAIHDARIAQVAKEAHDSVFTGEKFELPPLDFLSFERATNEAAETLQKSIRNGTWQAKCKGRNLLKSLCGHHRIKYEHFRNQLLSRLTEPPAGLKTIMDIILQ